MRRQVSGVRKSDRSVGSVRSARSVGCVLLLLVGALQAATFDEQRKAVAASPATQPERAILALLQAGLEEGKPTQAIAEASKWLLQNQAADGLLLYYAGRASELSGDAKGAVALYQQYLKSADLKSATADEALGAVYALLTVQLKDSNAAYAFSRTEGARLMVCPRARQFDAWFLDEAVQRQDAVAVAQRLQACIAAGVPADLLTVRYASYFRWLLGTLEGYCDAPRGIPVTQDLYDAVKSLCAAMTQDEELKLRLDWALSVKAYNLARNGNATTKVVDRHAAAKALANATGKKPAGKKGVDQKAIAAQAVDEKKLDLADTAPPIAEAEALLEKFPRAVFVVMTGWAGGGDGSYYRGDPRKYWPHEAEAKMAPILAALSKLTPAESAEFLNAMGYGSYVSSPRIFEIKTVQDYLRATPALLRGRNGVMILEKEWTKLTPDEAQKLAPQLAQVANPQASLVCAIAAGGKDYDKVMAALLGPEAWRLGPGELAGRGPYADSLWHYCGRPGGSAKYTEGLAKSKALADSCAAGDAKKEDPADKRLAAFHMLWADYRAAQPKLPAVRSRLMTVLKFTPEVVPELLKDASPEAQSLVRDALADGMEDAKGPLEREARIKGISGLVYAPWIQRLENLYGQRLKQDLKNWYAPHPLEAVLRQAVAAGLAQNKLEPWQILAWINLQFPGDNAGQVKLMQALCKSPAWVSLPSEVQYGAREWFKQDAMTAAQIAWADAADSKLVCKDLLALPKDADVKATVAALDQVIKGLRQAPVKLEVQGLSQLAAVSEAVFTDEQVVGRLLEIFDTLHAAGKTDAFGARLAAWANAKRTPVVLHRSAVALWLQAVNTPQYQGFAAMRNLAQALVDDQPSAASALARTGLQVFDGVKGGWGFNPEADLPSLKAVVGQAAMKMGLAVIPVAQNDPAYPIYKSQADWQSGNEESAWALCSAHWDQLLPMHRSLSMEYLKWLLQRTIYSRDESRQEPLIKALLAWAREPNTTVSLPQKVAFEIAYGDMAVQRSMLKEAHEIFTRTSQEKAYKGLMEQHTATLRKAAVERLEKNFDAALQTLSDLEMEHVPELGLTIRYARAEVNFDRGEYNDAAKDIDSILVREPEHAEARIMQGKLQIKRQKLMEATEVEIGSVSNLVRLVPGEKLKVTLNDPAMAVSSAGSEIEVVVWTTAGDRETFLLRQFGDQKTKFRGEVATALGAPAPGDHVLQVIGADEIYYAYSERFRKKMNIAEEMRGGPITVGSDALLMASARKLLSESEQRVADLQEQMVAQKKFGASYVAALRSTRLKSAQDAGASAEDEDRLDREALQTRLLEAQVKPGNPIYVRVIDPDRCRKPGTNEVPVSVETSSGDSIRRVVLKETGPFTGWFEGRIPTAAAQAMAFAENSEPGRNPNMVISPVASYPAWRPIAQSGKVPEFNIDLNDDAELGELTITAREPGAKLKKFLLRTGLNMNELTTVAAYPVDQISLKNPWQPSVTVMNDTDSYHVSGGRSVYALAELVAHLERGWMSQQFAQGLATNVAGPSAAFPADILSAVKWLRQGQYASPSVIYRFQGYFYEAAEVTRRFSLELGPYEIPKNTHPSVIHPPQFMLAVDGKPLTKSGGRLEGESTLKPGVHRFEIWATGWINNMGFGRTAKLRANLADLAKLVDCPNEFFDSATFPKGKLSPRNGTAVITPNADGTEFKVRFKSGSRAHLLSLVCLNQEGPVPVLNKIALVGPDKKPVLPVAQDFASLNKNDTLEVLPGDKVTVRYVDDRFVTKGKETHERFLNAAFCNAELSFQHQETWQDRGGNDVIKYEPIRRFAFDVPVWLTIQDPDMDVSSKPDKVTVILESKAGGKRTVAVTETGDATGIFRIALTPVRGTPANATQIQAVDGDTITAIYRDQENTDPGVPVDRYASIRQAQFVAPEMRLSHATVTPLATNEQPESRVLNEGFAFLENQQEELSKMSFAERQALEAGRGKVQPRWHLAYEMLSASTAPAGGLAAVLGQRLYVELVAPCLALTESSQVDVYFQTDAGRAAARATAPAGDEGKAIPAGGASTAPAFDIKVPGTIKLAAELDSQVGYGVERQALPIYVADVPAAGRRAERFVCNVLLIDGVLPEYGVLTAAELEARRKAHQPILSPGLIVKPGEKVHVGFCYPDSNGTQQWLTASAKVLTDAVLDVMAENYRTARTNAYVGEALCLRVVDLGADVSDRSDAVTVSLKAKSGAAQSVELREVDTHSGVFKGVCVLSYAVSHTASDAAPEKAAGLQVVYGDVVEASYTDAAGRTTKPQPVNISKGADGSISPFSKKYEDAAMAMRTQFALAESSLEVARNYRALGETNTADREYASAKQLLASVVDQFRDPETRAHAEYLLGILTLEEADASSQTDLKEGRYRAALSRFMNVAGTYPNTLHASKAQFKIATVYEKLNEPEIAAQEYVKLAYKYPESEFLGTAMARLGAHFQRIAADYEKRAKALLEKTDNKDAQFEGTAMQKMAVSEYLKAANIFAKLFERFPSHELAGTGGLRAGQSYMRAGANRQAVKILLQVANNESYNGPDIRAQSMYWAGMCYEALKEPMAAYSIYKRLTFDFPESKWASYARAQLSQDNLQGLETDLEIKRLEQKK